MIEDKKLKRMKLIMTFYMTGIDLGIDKEEIRKFMILHGINEEK